MTDKMFENTQAEMLANTADVRGRKALYEAVYNGDPETVRVLLENNACPDDMPSLLFTAVKSRDAETVRMVLQLGADPDSRNKNGETPLYFAACLCLTKTVQVLLEYGAAPDSRDKNGQTPIWIAAQKGMVEIVQMLVLAGADPHTGDYRGQSPFWIAVSLGDTLGHRQTARFLVQDCGANPNSRNQDGETPVWKAASRGYTETVRMLVRDLGADPNTCNNRGKSPVAVAFPRIETMRVLLQECGANPDTADSEGLTPVMLAAMNGCTEIVRVLVEAGVDPDTPDGNGVTPIFHAARYGQDNLVWLLAREWGVDLTRKQPRLAFAMGQHQRLGAASAVRSLSADLVHKILNYATPWASQNTGPSYRNSLPLCEWLASIQDAPPAYAEHNAGLLGSFECSMCNHATDQAVALVPCAHRVCRRYWGALQHSQVTRGELPSCPTCQAVVYHTVPQEQFPDQARLSDVGPAGDAMRP